MTEIHYNVNANTAMRETVESRTAILKEANRIINGDRHRAYGPAENTFGLIARYWTDYLNIKIEASDVAKMMILMKVARSSHGYKTDNYIDIAGYAALGAEIEAMEVEMRPREANVTSH